MPAHQQLLAAINSSGSSGPEWISTVDHAITDVNADVNGTDFTYWTDITFPRSGTVTILRIYLSNIQYDGNQFKMALYNNSLALLGSKGRALNSSEENNWVEFILDSGISVTAATYKISWQGQGNSTDFQWRQKSGTGATTVAAGNVNFGDYPEATLDTSGSFSGGSVTAVGAYLT